ncbi:hypothetical protein V7149_24850 [Bacillus sp. JJ1503]|uniref:hypothetical protein n=1 Tax=Bacillus sp. JJ1503 TaxID=3122956 RepID=UPI002FFD5C81
MKENFSSAKWDELLKMLPDKAEDGITGHAAKLGLKRESEKLEPYYDEEKEAWVQSTINYRKIKSTVTTVMPAKKGTTFEQANDRLVDNMARAIFDTTQSRYNEFILPIGLKYSTEKLISIFYKWDLDLFLAGGKSKEEQDEINKMYKDEIINEIERVNGLIKNRD